MRAFSAFFSPHLDLLVARCAALHPRVVVQALCKCASAFAGLGLMYILSSRYSRWDNPAKVLIGISNAFGGAVLVDALTGGRSTMSGASKTKLQRSSSLLLHDMASAAIALQLLK